MASSGTLLKIIPAVNSYEGYAYNDTEIGKYKSEIVACFKSIEKSLEDIIENNKKIIKNGGASGEYDAMLKKVNNKVKARKEKVKSRREHFVSKLEKAENKYMKQELKRLRELVEKYISSSDADDSNGSGGSGVPDGSVEPI